MDAFEQLATDNENHELKPEQQRQLQAVLADHIINMMDYSQLVVLAIKYKLPGDCLINAESVRNRLRRYRDEHTSTMPSTQAAAPARQATQPPRMALAPAQPKPSDSSDMLDAFERLVDSAPKQQQQVNDAGRRMIPDDKALSLLLYSDLVILAAQCGIRVATLRDEDSARLELRHCRNRTGPYAPQPAGDGGEEGTTMV